MGTIGSQTVSARRTAVTNSATAVTLLSSNVSRAGARILNLSSATLFISLSGGTPTTTDYDVELVADAAYELPLLRGAGVYTGNITGIWATAPGGDAKIVEFMY